jgi:hypothetical protein
MKSLYLFFKYSIILFLKFIRTSAIDNIRNTKESEIDRTNKIHSDIETTSSSDEIEHKSKTPYIQRFNPQSTATSEQNSTTIIFDSDQINCHQTITENNEQSRQFDNEIINDQINDCTGGKGDVGAKIIEKGNVRPRIIVKEGSGAYIIEQEDVEDCFVLACECCQGHFSSVGECCQGCFSSVGGFIRHSFESIGECFGSLGEGVSSLCENISSCLGGCCEGLGDCLGGCCERSDS